LDKGSATTLRETLDLAGAIVPVQSFNCKVIVRTSREENVGPDGETKGDYFLRFHCHGLRELLLLPTDNSGRKRKGGNSAQKGHPSRGEGIPGYSGRDLVTPAETEGGREHEGGKNKRGKSWSTNVDQITSVSYRGAEKKG